MRKAACVSGRRLPRIRLASNWRRLHRTYTVGLSMLLALLSAAQDQWPLFQTLITPGRFALISLCIAVLIALFRYIEQPALSPKDHDGAE